MKHTVLRQSAGYGFMFGPRAPLKGFRHNTVEANATGAGRLCVETVAGLDASTRFAGNTREVMVVENRRRKPLTSLQRWFAIDVPYLLIDPVTVAAPLRIDAGARLLFESDPGLRVSAAGRLTAVGTADKPIQLLGEQETRGYWPSVTLESAARKVSQLEHVVIKHARAMPRLLKNPRLPSGN